MEKRLILFRQLKGNCHLLAFLITKVLSFKLLVV